MGKYAVNDDFEGPRTENGQRSIQNHGQHCPVQLFSKATKQRQEMRQRLLGAFFSGLALSRDANHDRLLPLREIRKAERVRCVRVHFATSKMRHCHPKSWPLRRALVLRL